MLGTKILEERKSKYNGSLRVARSLGMGTYIQADGLTQSGGIVGTIWKPTLKRILDRKFEVESCLILGIGGGTAAKYIRLFYPKAKITGIDIDPVIVELGKKYLGLREIGVDIKIGDAGEIKNVKYDLAIVDLYNGDKFPEKFEDEKFLKRLTGSKLVIFNRLSYGDKKREAIKFGKKLEKIFKEVEWFYPEVNVMFICTS